MVSVHLSEDELSENRTDTIFPIFPDTWRSLTAPVPVAVRGPAGVRVGRCPHLRVPTGIRVVDLLLAHVPTGIRVVSRHLPAGRSGVGVVPRPPCRRGPGVRVVVSPPTLYLAVHAGRGCEPERQGQPGEWQESVTHRLLLRVTEEPSIHRAARFPYRAARVAPNGVISGC